MGKVSHNTNEVHVDLPHEQTKISELICKQNSHELEPEEYVYQFMCITQYVLAGGVNNVYA